MRACGLVLALVLGGACGDDLSTGPRLDAGPGEIDATTDAPPDAPPEVTFTSFVIDLVQAQTSDITDPVPHATFSGLNDPDQDNASAYTILFP